jgi:drug/metabolite transporter (DMT)-like permease
LELVGALFWALHVIVVGLAVRHTDVLTFSSGQYLTVGALNLLVSLAMQSPWGGIRDGWWTIAYIAFLSTAIGYTLQAYGQIHSPPTDVTILLSMEAVFAVLVGYTFLDERMELIQLVGCGMIIAAVIITQARLFLPKADVI